MSFQMLGVFNQIGVGPLRHGRHNKRPDFIILKVHGNKRGKKVRADPLKPWRVGRAMGVQIIIHPV